MSSDTASPDIEQFIDDAETFLKIHVVNCQVTREPQSTSGYAKLLRTEHGYDLKHQGRNYEQNTAFAYYLGYKCCNQSSPHPTCVDIPRNPVGGRAFLFTGTLTGCSVVATRHPTDPTLYRVFHDAREKSSLFYDNVEMAVDLPDYRIRVQDGAGVSTAAVFMQYKDNHWRMFVQLQDWTLAEIPYLKLRTVQTGESAVIIRDPGSYDQPRNLEDFRRHREQTQNEVLELGRELNFNLDPTPGVFEPAPVRLDLENGAVRRWTNLRKEIENSQKEKHERLQRKLLGIEKLTSGGSNDIKQLFLAISKSTKTEISAKKQKYEPPLEASRYADFVWLWLEKKRVEGFDAVVQLQRDVQLRAGIETIGERYSEVELDLLRRTNTAFAEGFDDYESVAIPGFKQDMTSEESKRLFLQPDLSDRKRGALMRH
ncbi:hypothetical protein RUND412_011386, partial [Rhizina undulata]